MRRLEEGPVLGPRGALLLNVAHDLCLDNPRPEQIRMGWSGKSNRLRSFVEEHERG